MARECGRPIAHYIVDAARAGLRGDSACMECGGSDILARMVRVTSLMLTAALIVASTPAAAADPMGALLDQIQRAQDRKQFKRAADLAAPASQRTDLRPADRFLLAGLAAESYGEAFEHGGAPRQPRHDPAFLCAQRAVLQEALALTDEPRKVDDALGKVAAQLAQVATSGRDVPCALAPAVSEAEPLPTAETPPGEATMAAALQITVTQFEALTVGLPWRRLGELSVISRC